MYMYVYTPLHPLFLCAGDRTPSCPPGTDRVRAGHT